MSAERIALDAVLEYARKSDQENADLRKRLDRAEAELCGLSQKPQMQATDGYIPEGIAPPADAHTGRISLGHTQPKSAFKPQPSNMGVEVKTGEGVPLRNPLEKRFGYRDGNEIRSGLFLGTHGEFIKVTTGLGTEMLVRPADVLPQHTEMVKSWCEGVPF